jgi:hypothetical protein
MSEWEGDVELGTSVQGDSAAADGAAGGDKSPGQLQREPSEDLKPRDFWFYFTLIYEEIIITDDMPNLVQYLCPYDPDQIISPWTYMWMSIIITLRGVSQVYLCAHPIAAIFICIGTFHLFLSLPSLTAPISPPQLLVCHLEPC